MNEDKLVEDTLDSLDKCAMQVIVQSKEGSNLTKEQCDIYFPGKENCGYNCMDFKVYTWDKSATLIKMSSITAVMGMVIGSFY